MRILGNRLLVKEVLPGKKTAGGIFIPEQSREADRFGSTKLWDVLQIGPGKMSGFFNIPVPMEPLPGDRVITFSHTSGALPLPDGTAIIRDDLILAIIPKDKRYENEDHQGAGC